MKKCLLIFFILGIKGVFAQVNDSFTDGNFTANPTWTGSGSSADFVVLSGQLRSNSTTASSNFYLSTPNSLSVNCIWEFRVNLKFLTSGANYVDVYLVSDQQNLQAASLNGYFVRLGGTNDEISLYKRSGSLGSAVLLVDGINSSLNTADNIARVRVSRTAAGLFTLERDLAGGTSYTSEGTTTDIAFSNTVAFGVYVQQSTATFHQKHFFDDFKVYPLVTDHTPPQLVSVSVTDSLHLEITFNEPVDSVGALHPANYSIDHGIDMPLTINRIDQVKYRLSLAKGLSTDSYSLSVNSVADLAGNLIAPGSKIAFSYTKPYTPVWGDVVINEIFADPSPQIDLPSVEFIELFNTTDRTLHLSGWKYGDAGSSVPLPADSILPRSYLILCARADTAQYKVYGKTIGLSPWPSLNNTSDILKLLNQQGRMIDSVAYADTWYRNAVKRGGGWTLERMDPGSTCRGLFNWRASADSAGGTPGKVNSVYHPAYDSVPFRADSLKLLSDSAVQVFFNKPIDKETIQAGGFTLNPGGGLPQRTAPDMYYTSLVLAYKKFSAGTSYSLSIRSLKDCSGNILAPADFAFSTPKARTDTGRIIINEVFANPSPEIGLPLAEFIELYNPGKDTLDLSDWTINDADTHSTLKNIKLKPGGYFILCPSADTAQYQAFGTVLGLSPWPSLGNAADQLVLRSHTGRLVDSVGYSDQWYKDPVKRNGGYSLEKISPESICTGNMIWTASRHTDGGTPGRVNSVWLDRYDQIALTVDSFKRVNDSTILVHFNKPVDSASLGNATIRLEPETSRASAKVLPDLKTLGLYYQTKFSPGITYTLSLNGVSSCSGAAASGSFSFSMQSLPVARTDTGRAIITEIFADPSPVIGLPDAEFIELYNPGKDTLNLDGWNLSGSRIQNVRMTPGSFLILTTGADTAAYQPYGKVHGITPWKTLTNTAGNLILKSFTNRAVDSVTYSAAWYKDPVKMQGGWSLEKIDYVAANCSQFYNWEASLHTDGGTPGKSNSRFKPGYTDKSLLIDSVRILTDSTIRVFLNTIPDTALLRSAVYQVDPHPVHAKLKSIAPAFRELDLWLSEPIVENTRHVLSITGLHTCNGETGLLTAAFTSPAVPERDYPVVINEIFADSSPVIGLPDAEFIELYNPTASPVQLAGMSYEDETTQFIFKSGTIAAGDYLILCAAKDTALFKPYGKTYGISPWPALNNDKDILTLKNNKGRIIQRIAYSDTWYKNDNARLGGYSLEMVDAAATCTGIQNWAASMHSSGGTPGKVNAVHGTNTSAEPLRVVATEIIDSLNLKVVFNRAVDSLSAAYPINFEVNNGIGKPVSALPLGPQFESVVLYFGTPLNKGLLYRVTARSVTDCSGQALSITANTAEVFYPKDISRNDILISEVLFNPRPGGSDFVEIYNNSRDILDLGELSVAAADLKDSLISVRPVSLSKLLIQPGQYVALTTDPDHIRANYSIQNLSALLRIQAMPPFNDDKGTVVLLSKSRRIDRFSYSAEMHFKLIKDPEGVSLERSNFTRPANEPGNFRSATQAAGYATPGYRNSQYADGSSPAGSLSLSSKTFSPDNDGFEDQLQVNYRFERAGLSANLAIYNDKGILVKKLASNTTLNAEGAISWDGFDEENNRCPVGIYLIYVEIFDLNGYRRKYRLPFVLAAKLK